MSDLAGSLRLARTDGVGPIAYRRLIARYGTARAALDNLPALARAGGGRPPAIPGKAAIEDENVCMAKNPEHPPGAGGRKDAALIIDHDFGPIADAEPRNRIRELPRAGQHVG